MGGEYNAVRKDHQSVEVKFALAFPDAYEIGMSNLGVRILYHTLNKRDDTVAERVFAPWTDMEAEMRQRKLPLFALESKTPVKDFDILGFSLGYELSFTNVLNMLDLADIPVRASERAEGHPLIIAGGCCVFNPEPMTDFIDAFVVGEGEEVVHEFIDAFKAHRDEGKERLLLALAQIPGVYVPSLYEVSYNTDGTVNAVRPSESGSADPSCVSVVDVWEGGVPRTVTKRVMWDLDSADYPDSFVMPFIETVHDRVSLEVMRGCSRGCRFCQAGMIYRPVRQRSQERLLELAGRLCDNTGYDEISLMSLSTADYKGIEDLVGTFIAKYEEEKIGLSLPSMRADANCVALAAEIQKIRKSGLTLAPEAGTQRMRDVIDKDVTEGDLLGAVEAAFRYGWKRVKLYFMIGLPTETDEDIAGIADLASKVAQVGRRMGIRPTVGVSVSSLVPKPHTPFQWRAQDTIEEIERKQRILKDSMRSRDVSLSWHDAYTSRLEAVLARGDRRLGRAILLAWRKGCIFDAWSEYFHYDRWMEAISEAGLDAGFYANRKRDYGETLPWDHIDCGVSKQFLIAENERAETGEVTRDCRLDKCAGCGVSSMPGAQVCTTRIPSPLEGEGKGEGEDQAGLHLHSHREDTAADLRSACSHNTELVGAQSLPAGGRDPAPSPPPARGGGIESVQPGMFRVMLSLRKGEEVKYLSHRDFIHTFELALRRARVPIAHSQGFNPRPKMSFGSAIGVGVMSEDERIQLELAAPLAASDVKDALNASLPPGMEVLGANMVPEGEKSPISLLNASEFRIGISGEGCDPNNVQAALDQLLVSSEIRVIREKEGARKELDIRPYLVSAVQQSASDEALTVTVVLRFGDSGGAGPRDFLQAIKRILPGLEVQAVCRTRQFASPKTSEA
jgi:radical SAM family uncharacterized protein/radical SAM-linked protein